MPKLMNIKQLVKMTNLTSKTLRHWEEKGLLNPQRDVNDYRLYSENDLTRIFYIMSLRRLDLPIDEIKIILADNTSEQATLNKHLNRLKTARTQLNVLITNLEKKLTMGEYQMNDHDFKLFKEAQLAQNTTQYGEEVQQRWGTDTFARSNEQYLAATQTELTDANTIHQQMLELLETAYLDQDQAIANQAVTLHIKFLKIFWPQDLLNEVSHKALADMYCADERFRKNYDRNYPKLPEFFRDAIYSYYQ
ncbi:MerR family transcriptional regulator [Weissella muntiaci]|uniref:MerR family transcriptional regulator n=1 Tax=Weissella muntiaci TaxID=2508881 RepID=A0A6C2C533_9LACO|nr:TipAS antibiotic-recognition domain-containing protein [Weissella muntiaci]TYC49004.1 MerR family transcriptional regulator [Weissella muntiaci]